MAFSPVAPASPNAAGSASTGFTLPPFIPRTTALFNGSPPGSNRRIILYSFILLACPSTPRLPSPPPCSGASTSSTRCAATWPSTLATPTEPWTGALRRLAAAEATVGSTSIEGYGASLEDTVEILAGRHPVEHIRGDPADHRGLRAGDGSRRRAGGRQPFRVVAADDPRAAFPGLPPAARGRAWPVARRPGDRDPRPRARSLPAAGVERGAGAVSKS